MAGQRHVAQPDRPLAVTAPVELATRELHDLVCRICRVEGLAPGEATTLSEAVTHASLVGRDGRGAVACFIDALDRGALTAVMAAIDAIRLAEVDARTTGQGSATIDPPVAEPLLLSTVATAQLRGAHRVASSQVSQAPYDESARHSTGVTAMTFERSDDPEPRDPQLGRVFGTHVVEVDRSILDQLQIRADRFLVSEAALDNLGSDRVQMPDIGPGADF